MLTQVLLSSTLHMDHDVVPSLVKTKCAPPCTVFSSGNSHGFSKEFQNWSV